AARLDRDVRLSVHRQSSLQPRPRPGFGARRARARGILTFLVVIARSDSDEATQSFDANSAGLLRFACNNERSAQTVTAQHLAHGLDHFFFRHRALRLNLLL